MDWMWGALRNPCYTAVVTPSHHTVFDTMIGALEQAGVLSSLSGTADHSDPKRTQQAKRQLLLQEMIRLCKSNTRVMFDTAYLCHKEDPDPVVVDIINLWRQAHDLPEVTQVDLTQDRGLIILRPRRILDETLCQALIRKEARPQHRDSPLHESVRMEGHGHQEDPPDDMYLLSAFKKGAIGALITLLDSIPEPLQEAYVVVDDPNGEISSILAHRYPHVEFFPVWEMAPHEFSRTMASGASALVLDRHNLVRDLDGYRSILAIYGEQGEAEVRLPILRFCGRNMSYSCLTGSSILPYPSRCTIGSLIQDHLLSEYIGACMRDRNGWAVSCVARQAWVKELLGVYPGTYREAAVAARETRVKMLAEIHRIAGSNRITAQAGSQDAEEEIPRVRRQLRALLSLYLQCSTLYHVLASRIEFWFIGAKSLHVHSSSLYARGRVCESRNCRREGVWENFSSGGVLGEDRAQLAVLRFYLEQRDPGGTPGEGSWGVGSDGET